MAAAALLIVCAAPPVHAWEYRELKEHVKARVSASLRNDDNVFRVPDGINVATPDGELRRSDWIYTLGAGVTLEIPVSRQRFAVSYDLTRTRYGHFTNLDFDGFEARATWYWEFGRRASGTAGVSRTETRADFATSLGRTPNTLTSTRAYVSGAYPFHAEWQVNWGLSHAQGRNSDALNQVSDNDGTTVFGELRHVTGRGSYVGLQGTYTKVDFINPLVTFAGVLDSSYTQYSLGIVGAYTLGGSSSITAALSQSRREPEASGGTSTSATTGSLALNWQPTGKTTLAVSIARDFSPPENITVSGSVANTYGMVLNWRATAKVSVRAQASWQDRNYLFAANNPALRRRDKTNVQSLSATYAVLDKLSLTLSGTREQRDSDLQQAVYRTKGFGVTAELAF